jgi:hypothetical protein
MVCKYLGRKGDGDGDGDRTQRTQKLRKGRKKENTKKIPKRILKI